MFDSHAVWFRIERETIVGEIPLEDKSNGQTWKRWRTPWQRPKRIAVALQTRCLREWVVLDLCTSDPNPAEKQYIFVFNLSRIKEYNIIAKNVKVTKNVTIIYLIVRSWWTRRVTTLEMVFPKLCLHSLIKKEQANQLDTCFCYSVLQPLPIKYYVKLNNIKMIVMKKTGVIGFRKE
jgi:hypothetical protein